tara:strand:+ start:8460 stop:8624 length:165 start_codon:yes stop_codon:yes gene_type:complete
MSETLTIALMWGVCTFVIAWITGIICASYGYKKQEEKTFQWKVLDLLNDISKKH